MRNGIIGIVLCCLSVAGCVKKSEFEALQQQMKNKMGELDAATTEAASLDEQLAQKEAELEATNEKLAETEERLAKAEAANDELQGELARLLKDKSSLKESAAKLQEALKELAQRKAAAEKRVAEFKQLLARFQKLIDAGKLKVRIVEGRMVLVLPTDILFASGSARLSDVGDAAIREVASVLATMADKRFQVEGHTDNVPIKNRQFRNNWELASGRALNVVETLTEAAVPGEALSAAGYGEFRPVAANDTAENRAVNRRIEIVLVPDLSELPGFAELQKAVADR